MYVGQSDINIVSAATRLIELMAQPGAELLEPIVVDEILIRLLFSPNRCSGGPDRHLGIRCARSRQSYSLVASQFLPAHESPRTGSVGAHECFLFSPALQIRHFIEPLAIPKGSAPAGGEASYVVRIHGRQYREFPRRVCQYFAIQQRIQPLLRECSSQEHRQVA